MKNIRIVLSKIFFWLGWPVGVIAVRLNVRTRVLMVCEGEVFVVKGWIGDGKWTLPGGGLHRNEDPLTGALRELKEETGIVLAPDQAKLIGKKVQSEHGLKLTYFLGVAEVSKKPEATLRNVEIVQMAWLKPEELTQTIAQQHVLQAVDTWRK